jgi:hypothetical protein
VAEREDSNLSPLAVDLVQEVVPGGDGEPAHTTEAPGRDSSPDFWNAAQQINRVVDLARQQLRRGTAVRPPPRYGFRHLIGGPRCENDGERR